MNILWNPVFAQMTAREWALQLAIWCADKKPRFYRAACRKVFETYGHPQPDDLFGWLTYGEISDAEADTWENMIPETGELEIQMRRSQVLNVGRKGPVHHPTKMQAFAQPIRIKA